MRLYIVCIVSWIVTIGLRWDNLVGQQLPAVVVAWIILFILDCGDPPGVENGSITLFDPSNTSLAATATLTCNQGYNTSLTTLRCGENGNWDNATCILAGYVFFYLLYNSSICYLTYRKPQTNIDILKYMIKTFDV